MIHWSSCERTFFKSDEKHIFSSSFQLKWHCCRRFVRHPLWHDAVTFSHISCSSHFEGDKKCNFSMYLCGPDFYMRVHVLPLIHSIPSECVCVCVYTYMCFIVNVCVRVCTAVESFCSTWILHIDVFSAKYFCFHPLLLVAVLFLLYRWEMYCTLLMRMCVYDSTARYPKHVQMLANRVCAF